MNPANRSIGRAHLPKPASTEDRETLNDSWGFAQALRGISVSESNRLAA
jgi:hypothetical protein